MARGKKRALGMIFSVALFGTGLGLRVATSR